MLLLTAPYIKLCKDFVVVAFKRFNFFKSLTFPTAQLVNVAYRRQPPQARIYSWFIMVWAWHVLRLWESKQLETNETTSCFLLIFSVLQKCYSAIIQQFQPFYHGLDIKFHFLLVHCHLGNLSDDVVHLYFIRPSNAVELWFYPTSCNALFLSLISILQAKMPRKVSPFSTMQGIYVAEMFIVSTCTRYETELCFSGLLLFCRKTF